MHGFRRPPGRRLALALIPGLALGLASAKPAAAQSDSSVRLFRASLARGEVVIGLSPAELDALGSGPAVERIARRIAEQGQITAWRYTVTRGQDGVLRLAARDRVAVLRHEALLIEPYRPALPVVPLPSD